MKTRRYLALALLTATMAFLFWLLTQSPQAVRSIRSDLTQTNGFVRAVLISATNEVAVRPSASNDSLGMEAGKREQKSIPEASATSNQPGTPPDLPATNSTANFPNRGPIYPALPPVVSPVPMPVQLSPNLAPVVAPDTNRPYGGP